MKKIDWKSKLSSRKFWMAVATEIGSVLGAIGLKDDLIGRVVCIISAVGTVITYILSEAMVDARRAEQTVKVEVDEQAKNTN